jgi:hypothetical protein
LGWPWKRKIEPLTIAPAVSERKMEMRPLRCISQPTIALMIGEYQYLFSSQSVGRAWWNDTPLMDVDKLSISLFGMGFDQGFLDTCRREYHWNFASLFPALHDGSFYTVHRSSSSGRAMETGSTMLRGFATALCGILAQTGEFDTETAKEFQSSLLKDGFQFVGTRLVETSQDIIPEAQEISAVESLIRRSIHDNRGLLLSHFADGRSLYDRGPYHACINEWRSFLEETLRGVWRITKAHRSEFATFAEKPSVKDLFNFLNRSGFLDSDEKEAFNGAWGFLSVGGHPGISDKDAAHLSMILALTFAHAALLKLQKWADNSYSHF